ncbi:hypothetical protein [Epilithonimonas xixisoli]|uniref:DUF4136 domain-containing protein n=1 Tax=Epilithonimonas xixisoli TaxID=1476462 RepID=A0A4R8I5R5_9FLAO|nr:hypothetical protein [Epilithonimonas xixisoli]TDX83320.1 hypothetical protein B0I22_3400 [Epilithonimonas xixisoli]
MKNKTLQTPMVTAILLLGFLFFANTAKAQDTKTVYYFGMSRLANKKFAVTPILSSQIKKTNHVETCVSQLKMYLMDYIPAETSYKIDWSNRSLAVDGLSGSTRSQAENIRLKMINQYKEYGYEIVHLNYTSFSCDQ